MRVQFGIGDYQHRASKVGNQRLLNCYLEQEPQGTPNPIALLGSYGISSFATPGNGPMRGGLVVNGVAYVVSGTGLYSLTSAGAATLLGTIPNLDRIDMAGDGTNLMIVTQGDGYHWNGTTVAQITDADFPGADWVEYLDTYFVIGRNGQIWLSGSLDPSSWDALDFATAEASPDDIVGGLVEKRELFLGGRDSFEVWYNDANADFPLQRTGSGTAEVGLLAKDTLQKYDNRLFFVATDYTVRNMDGYTPLIISKPDISQAIEDLTDAEKESMYGLTWTEGGHLFYGITSDQWTLVYDTYTREWYRRQSLGYNNWRALFALSLPNYFLMADRESNEIGKLSGTTFTEWGDTMQMIGTAQIRHSGNVRQTASRCELVFEAGVGNSGQGEDPVVGLRQSFDAGKTWGAQRFRKLGKTGEYEARGVWHRLGQARSRVLEFEISDPVRRALLYAEVDEERGYA